MANRMGIAKSSTTNPTNKSAAVAGHGMSRLGLFELRRVRLSARYLGDALGNFPNDRGRSANALEAHTVFVLHQHRDRLHPTAATHAGATTFLRTGLPFADAKSKSNGDQRNDGSTVDFYRFAEDRSGVQYPLELFDGGFKILPTSMIPSLRLSGPLAACVPGFATVEHTRRDRHAMVRCVVAHSRTAAIVVLVVVAACDSPSLTIELVAPPEQTEKPTRTVVSTYVSESLTCDAIAFGDVVSADLDASRIQEIDLAQTSVLSDLPRLDRKLVVARSYIGERGDVPAAAGCAEVEGITGDTSVRIDGNAIGSVALGGTLGSGGFVGRKIRVDADQPNGTPLAGREVRWTTIGPSGSFDGANQLTSTQAGEVITTNDRGRAEFEPVESDVYGPMVARVTVAWADRPLPLVQGFMQGEHTVIPLDASGNTQSSPPVCVTRRHLGKPTVACLVTAGSSRRVVELSLRGSGVETRDLTEPGAEIAFSLSAVSESTGDSEPLYAILSDGRWLGLDGTPDGATADLCRMRNGECTVAPVRSVALPGCDGATPRVLIELARKNGKNQFDAFTPNGIRVPGLATRLVGDVQLIAAGCVGYGETLTQAVVVTAAEMSSGQNSVFIDCEAETACSASWVGSPVATFSPGPSPGDLPRLIGSVTDITGPVMVDWTLAPDVRDNGAPAVVLRERRRTPAVSFPIGVAAGHFDADSVIDLAWTVVVGDDQQRGRMQLALAPQAAGQRLTGLGGRMVGTPLTLISTDLDCDGRDDLVSVTATATHVVRTGTPLVGPPPPSGC